MSASPTDPGIEREETLMGQLIAEIAKFGGMEKEQASRLARILLPHIAATVRQSNKELLERLHRTDGPDLPKRDYDNVTDVAIDAELDALQPPQPASKEEHERTL